MYILVNLNKYYPSILHFNTKQDALDFANRNNLNDEYESYHIAKVEYSHNGFMSEREEKENIEWGLYDE